MVAAIRTESVGYAIMSARCALAMHDVGCFGMQAFGVHQREYGYNSVDMGYAEASAGCSTSAG